MNGIVSAVGAALGRGDRRRPACGQPVAGGLRGDRRGALARRACAARVGVCAARLAHLTAAAATSGRAHHATLGRRGQAFGAEGFFLPIYRSLHDARVRIIHDLSRERAAGDHRAGGLRPFRRGSRRSPPLPHRTGHVHPGRGGLAIVVVQQLLDQLRAASSSAASMHESSPPPRPHLVPRHPQADDGARVPTADSAAAASVAGGRRGPRTRPRLVLLPGTDRPCCTTCRSTWTEARSVALRSERRGEEHLVKVLCGLYADVGPRGDDRRQRRARASLDRRSDTWSRPCSRTSAGTHSPRGRTSRWRSTNADDDDAMREAARRRGHSCRDRAPSAGYDITLRASSRWHGPVDRPVATAGPGPALFRDAPFMVLDEPTAASDAANERAFLDTLRRTCCDRGILLITHRLFDGAARRSRVRPRRRADRRGGRSELNERGGLNAESTRLHEGCEARGYALPCGLLKPGKRRRLPDEAPPVARVI